MEDSFEVPRNKESFKENQANQQQAPEPSERYTFVSVVVDERKSSTKSVFTNVQQQINEVRYMLKDEIEKQKVLKIGSHKGKIKVHFRDYIGFSNAREGFPTKKGYSLSYEEFCFLESNMAHISRDCHELHHKMMTADISSSSSSSQQNTSSLANAARVAAAAMNKDQRYSKRNVLGKKASSSNNHHF